VLSRLKSARFISEITPDVQTERSGTAHHGLIEYGNYGGWRHACLLIADVIAGRGH